MGTDTGPINAQPVDRLSKNSRQPATKWLTWPQNIPKDVFLVNGDGSQLTHWTLPVATEISHTFATPPTRYVPRPMTTPSPIIIIRP